VGEDALFLQHTYLTIVVKAIAARVLDLPVDDPAVLLSGRALADEGIIGAVERTSSIGCSSGRRARRWCGRWRSRRRGSASATSRSTS
jgi:hypothetical protein